jgi:hypothetical protein
VARCDDPHDCAENRTEIARHHRDFTRIRAILDEWDARQHDGETHLERLMYAKKALREVRSVVG